jgi:hypothetical protein
MPGQGNQGQGSGPGSAPTLLRNSTTTIPKVTYVPLKVPADEPTRKQLATSGGAVRKSSFVRSLNLQPGEVDAVLNPPANVPATTAPAANPLTVLLKAFEGQSIQSTLPAPSAFSAIADADLKSFGKALLAHRSQQLAAAQRPATPAAAAPPAASPATGAPATVVQRPSALVAGALGPAVDVALASTLVNAAAVAVNGFAAAADSATSPIGMLNLERIEMTPAGIERGGLIATIPLAPKERTVVVQQEWSVVTQEFTSVVTDSLENYSETGVTDNTQLAQSTTSQIAHNNQFNVNASVSGSYGFVTASVATNIASQDQNSKSATDSRQHSVQTTKKASSRSIQSHKTTISTSTTTGSSQSNTRMIENPSATDPMRIDYFSMMRKWYCALYRYGMRLTYDITVPEPAAAMREAYAQIDQLQKLAAQQFSFPIKHSEITAEIKPGDSEPYYLVLADKYSVDVPPPPSPSEAIIQLGPITPGKTDAATPTTFNVPSGYWINNIILSSLIGVHPDTDPFSVVGYKPFLTSANQWTDLCAGEGFLYHQTGAQSLTVLWTDSHHEDAENVYFTVYCVPTDVAVAQWQSTVWSALYNAAQNAFYAQQQAINAQISALQNKLVNVDTLTLRREENDEIMKCALRWLMGNDFEFMPKNVVDMFNKTAGSNVDYGIDFTGNDDLGLSSNDWSIAKQNLDRINFINQAIDWDNVLYFVYSYFWDVPQSWDFIRQIQHPDATRQAFLRAGSARVVLTVRKGWEVAWAYFVEFGETSMPPNVPPHAYLTIAQQIQDYDNTNYPGIPAANPNGGGPIDDGTPQLGTTSTSVLAPSASPVTIEVADSTGFRVGATAIIDNWTATANVQETQPIVAVPDATHITVGALSNAHSPANNQNKPYPVVQAGEAGVLIAEWFEYTPTSGTDIQVTSNLATIQ